MREGIDCQTVVPYTKLENARMRRSGHRSVTAHHRHCRGTADKINPADDFKVNRHTVS